MPKVQVQITDMPLYSQLLGMWATAAYCDTKEDAEVLKAKLEETGKVVRII